MNKFFILYISFFVILSAHAQMGKTISYTEKEYINKECKAFYTGEVLSLDNEYEAVVKHIAKVSSHFNNDRSSVVLENITNGIYSKHYTFHQTFGDIEIFNSQIKVNLDNNGRVYSMFDNSFDTKKWDINLIGNVLALDSLSVVAPFILKIPKLSAFVSHKVIFADYPLPIAVFSITFRTMSPCRQWLYLLDANGSIVYKHDLTMYYKIPGDTIVKARVYMPDPLTSAQTVYDSATGYCNDNYLDNVVLTAQEKTVNLKVYLDKTTDSLYLSNNNHNYLMGHTAGSLNGTIPATYINNPDFLFTRNNSQASFLYTNSFYWLSRMRTYLNDTLKIGVVLPDSVYVDPMATTVDNSDFNYGGWDPNHTIPSWFEFGVGGVPDAEDADVILHEHGHFVSYFLSPNSVGVGFERNSIDEGQADYWAASYSRSISTYHADWVFNWDGHNVFWPGRVCNTTDIYKGVGWSPTSGIHHNGQIGSTAMMDIWKQYGRDVADKLMIQANMGFAQNMTMPQGALLVKHADTLLYKGIHIPGICVAFSARNIFTGFCDTNSLLNSKRHDTIKLANSYFFGSNSDYAYISSNKYLYNVNIRVYNVSGQLLLSYENKSGNSFPISPSSLIPGVYFIEIITQETNKVFKIVKWQ